MIAGGLRRLVLITAALLLALPSASARAQVVDHDEGPDAVPEYKVSFVARRVIGKPNRLAMRKLVFQGLRSGERIQYTCRPCDGPGHETGPLRVTVHSSRYTYSLRKLTMRNSSKLTLYVLGRNFSRNRYYSINIKAGRLKLDREACFNLGENREVPCAEAMNDQLWASVSVCDPFKLSFRAYHPGGGDPGETVWARYVMQRNFADGLRWANVGDNGVTPFYEIGPANVSGQAGATFTFKSLVKDETLRGYVTFQWRRGSEVVRTAGRFTSPGRPTDAAFSDPPGYSSAACVL
jgi:hypothetical protein